MTAKVRIEAEIDEHTSSEIESWRRRQPVIPSRREAIRSLIGAGLTAEAVEAEAAR